SQGRNQCGGPLHIPGVTVGHAALQDHVGHPGIDAMVTLEWPPERCNCPRGTHGREQQDREPRGAANHAVVSAGAGSTRTALTLNSAIFAYGSRRGLVSRLAAASRKWKGMKIWPGACRSESRAPIRSEPRRLVTRIVSPSPMPRRMASTGLISATGTGSRESSPSERRVMVPVCQWYI